VLANSGGNGAVRELCDFVIQHRQRAARAVISEAVPEVRFSAPGRV
jgi:3-deoxy-D-manno-octulosonate 8-phosphate phosphatase KdsC-like HAD superfamily phosphatase